MTKIPSPLGEIKARMGEAARSAHRQEENINLIAVSKTFSAQDIRPLLDEGHRRFGENRVQEAQQKWPELKAEHSKNESDSIELHLIGPLQSNKTAQAVALFDAIHTIDREKIARAVSAEMEKQDKKPDLFVQVNTGLEPQKAGIPPEDAENFVNMCRDEIGLNIRGLMALPPLEDNPAPHFALLDKLAKRIGLVDL